MLAKRISQLQPGDRFIWGDRNTRRNMVVGGEALGLLVCAKIDEQREEVYFVTTSGEKASRFYQPTDIAILADAMGLGNLVHHDVYCAECKERFGAHSGVYCPDGANTWFVPNQADLENFHGEELSKAISGSTADCDDFFSSIGL